jgi:hypothetical protein
MEMLDYRTIIATLLVGFIGWVAMSVVDLKTDTAVIAVKVDENHKMLSVLWEDFLKDRTNGNLAWFHQQTDIKPTVQTEQ